MTKRTREALALLAKAGAAAITYAGQAGSKHLTFQIQAPNGKQQTFFMSATPSDHRGDLNKLSKVRQFCRHNAA